MSRWNNRAARAGRSPRLPQNILQFRGAAQKVRWRKPKPKKAKWPLALLVASPFFGVGVAWLWNNLATSVEGLSSNGSSDFSAEQYDVSFSECSGAARYTCVIDGDTFWLEGAKVRIADINTPEVSSPECARESELGAQATGRLIALLNQGGFSLETIERDVDRYGRKLRIVTRQGESIGQMLVDEGLAERWRGRRGSWC